MPGRARTRTGPAVEVPVPLQTRGACPPGDSLGRLKPAAWFGLVAAITVVAYSRSFKTPFQFDDFNVIVNNNFLRHPLTGTFFIFWARTRIVPYVTLALNLKLGGEDPFAFHVVNFSVHLLATLALFRLSMGLCRTPRLQGTELAANPLLLAVPAAFLFACHPIQVQSVTYVSQRMAAMATMFYLGTVLLYVRARNLQACGTKARTWPAYTGAALLALAAFLSKENTASLPIAIFLTEWVFFGKAMTRPALLRLAPFLALALSIPIVWWFLTASYSAPPPEAGTWAGRHFDHFLATLRKAADPSMASPIDYFLTQCIVIPRYLLLVFLPSGFTVDPDIAVAHGFSGHVLLGLGFLMLLLAFGIHITRRCPVLGFGILWFFVALSVESSFLPINDVMAEHRMYLAMPGVAFAVAALFALSLRRSPALTTAAGATVVVTLAVLTFARNEVWRSPVSLWQDAVTKSPRKVRPQINLGVALHEKGQLDEAIQHYCEALKIDPENKPAAANIDLALEEKLESGDVDLDLFVAKDGVAEVTPVHPCPPAGERREQKRRKVGAHTHPPSSSKSTERLPLR
jgi:protein O-mannosyl-transferase